MSSSLQPYGVYPPAGIPQQNTALGCHFLLQGIFPTQGLNLCLIHLLHCQVGSLPLAPSGKPNSHYKFCLMGLGSIWLTDLFSILYFPLFWAYTLGISCRQHLDNCSIWSDYSFTLIGKVTYLWLLTHSNFFLPLLTFLVLSFCFVYISFFFFNFILFLNFT